MDSKEMRRRLRAAADAFGLDDAGWEYDRSARRWEWHWVDGPAPARVAALLGDAAGQVRLERRLGPRAVAIGVILLALGRDDGGGRTWPDTAPDDPQHAPDDRVGALADALLDGAPHYAADDAGWLTRRLHERGGPAGLLRPFTGTAADAGDPLVMTPIEHLTARYVARAGGWQVAAAWRERLVVLDARTAVTHALADATAGRADRLAAVALLGDLRRELETLEHTAMDAAVQAGASYSDLGRALGVTRQVAHRRHQARAGQHPARLSPKR